MLNDIYIYERLNGGHGYSIGRVDKLNLKLILHTLKGQWISLGRATSGKKGRLECRSAKNSRHPPAKSRSDEGQAARFIISIS